MNFSPRDAVKEETVPTEEERGDNHVTSPGEPEGTAPAGEVQSIPNPPEDSGEEQHDAGHGDIHPCNEVWK